MLAFSVSGRTREFGMRLAVGAQPRHLLMGVITEGAVMAVSGIAAGAILGYELTRLASSYFSALQTPSAWPMIASVIVFATAWTAMIAACTTLDHTANQMRLTCASGLRLAINRDTPSVAYTPRIIWR